MGWVNLNDLDEKKRKEYEEKYQKRQQELREQAQRNKKNENEKATQTFTQAINKNGEFDFSNHTSTIGNLKKAYKNSLDYEKLNNSLDNIYKTREKQSLWEQVNNVAKNLSSSVSYMDKKSKAGGLQGVTGILQSATTDIANTLNKGSKKDVGELSKDYINSFMGLLNPAPKIPINSINQQIGVLADKNKTLTEKLVSLANNASTEAVNTIPGKQLFDAGMQVVGKMSPDSSEKLMEINTKIGKPSKELNEKLEEEGKTKDELTQTLGNTMQSVGNMAPSTIASLATRNPNIGLAAMGLSSKGQSTQEALDRGAELDEAVKIGNTKAMIEIGTEKLSGGVNIFGKGALDDIVERGIIDKVKNKVAKTLVQKGVDLSGEVLEETISDILGTIIDKGTVDPNAKYTISNWKDTAVTTVLSTAITNLLTGGIGGNNNQQINIENDSQIGYNQIKSEGDINGQQQRANQSINERRMVSNARTIRNDEQGGGTTIIENTQRENDGSRVRQDNLSKEGESIESAYKDNKNILKITEYAKKNPYTVPTREIQEVQSRAKELGIPLNIYSGEEGNIHIGLTDGKEVYLDINQKNTSKEDGSLMDRFSHEVLHYIKRNNNTSFESSINELRDNVIKNNSESIKKMIENKGYSTSKVSNKAISYLSEEVLADYSAKHLSGYDIDYNLPEDITYTLNTTLDDAITELKLKNNNSSQTSQNVNTQEQSNANIPLADKYKNISEEKNPTRHEIIQKNRQIAKENIENISTWKDKKKGSSYQLETMERNMYDIIPDKAEAKKINDTYFEPIHTSEAEKQRFINNYNDRIKQFELNKYESEAVQFLGEKKYNPDFYKGSQEDISTRNEIEAKIKKNIENGKISQEKVDNAIEEFRKIYDELFELENNTLKDNGYKEKPYRKGYFPHFIDYVPETKTEKILNGLGFKIDKRPLPTDIAGITEQFVPGKTWNKSSLERKGNKTDYNALKGFDTYISQAADNIFHTENIQRLRGLENEIRYQYSDKGIQERIDNILNDETLYEDEKQIELDKILEQTNNPMPNLVTELRRYTNALANKKSEADRSIENFTGRSIYSTVNAIENRFGANAVGLNIGSAVTNFIPITQAYSQVSTKNMGRAVLDTVKSYVKDDGFADKSAFLTSRLNQSEKLYKTSLEKISDKTSFLFNAIDEVTSNIVVRGKYLENIQDGMTESEALKNADQFARNVIADRSKGALPTKFEEKNPVTKIFTQFQLEVNNQYRYMFKDIPRDLAEKGLGNIALAFFKMFVGAWIYNEASEKITGRKPAFSPIDIAISSYKTITDKKQKTADKIINIGTEIGEQLPFVGGMLGGGRVPINGAIPSAKNLLKAGVGLTTGEMDSKKAINSIGKELSKPLYYLLPPFGGGQAKKSIEGLKTIKEGGSYGVDNKGEKTLQFPVENPKTRDYIKATLFGKYSLPLAKEYMNNGYKSLNAKDTKGYETTKIPYKEFLTYTEYTNSKLIKKEDKINFINKMNLSEQQKWDMYCYDIFDNTTREKDKGSQLQDAKYAVENGTTKKEYIKIYNKAKERKMNIPTKEENEELIKNNIKLKNYMDYSIKVHDETEKQKKDGTIKEDRQLKNRDKIKILLNGNYSDTEKKSIYSNYLNKQDKKIALVEKLGFPINQYLDYKTNEFENDKDSEGESISGTKRKKVYDYLTSIPDSKLSVENKKILLKASGISDYDDEVTDYIVNYKGITDDEKKDILEILGFKVDSKGNIKTKYFIPREKYL